MLYEKISLKGCYMKFILERALYEKVSLKGHCMKTFLWKGVVWKNLFELALYEHFFKRVFYETISLKRGCLKEVLWTGVVWKHFFERVLYEKNSPCTAFSHWNIVLATSRVPRTLVYLVYVFSFGSISRYLSRYSKCPKSRVFQENIWVLS